MLPVHTWLQPGSNRNLTERLNAVGGRKGLLAALKSLPALNYTSTIGPLPLRSPFAEVTLESSNLADKQRPPLPRNQPSTKAGTFTVGMSNLHHGKKGTTSGGAASWRGEECMLSTEQHSAQQLHGRGDLGSDKAADSHISDPDLPHLHARPMSGFAPHAEGSIEPKGPAIVSGCCLKSSMQHAINAAPVQHSTGEKCLDRHPVKKPMHIGSSLSGSELQAGFERDNEDNIDDQNTGPCNNDGAPQAQSCGVLSPKPYVDLSATLQAPSYSEGGPETSPGIAGCSMGNLLVPSSSEKRGRLGTMPRLPASSQSPVRKMRVGARDADYADLCNTAGPARSPAGPSQPVHQIQGLPCSRENVLKAETPGQACCEVRGQKPAPAQASPYQLGDKRFAQDVMPAAKRQRPAVPFVAVQVDPATTATMPGSIDYECWLSYLLLK